MRQLFLFLYFLFICEAGHAYNLSRVEYFLSQNKLPAAKAALAQEYKLATTREDKEQLEFVAAQLFLQEEDYEEAAAIYRKMLAVNPALMRVRFELGRVYFLLKQDDKARYNLRLVLNDKGLPATTRNYILHLLDVIRRRKAWGIYISLGLAPDSNVNLVSGRRMSCINFMGTPVCRELDNAESDIGFQGFLSAEYIYKFSEKWGLKAHFTTDALDYKDKTYSFWGLGGSLGPRYVMGATEISAGVSFRQQWNDQHRYNHAKGLYADMSADLSSRWSVYERLTLNDIDYNVPMYRLYNAMNYASYTRLVYGLTTRSYLAASAGISYEDSRYKWNSYWRQTYGLGYGRELPWGFMIYAEPNVSFTNYRAKRWFLSGRGGLAEWKRRDTTYGVYVSLSNRLLRVYNITPTLNFIYNKRTSNVFNYEYERSRWEIGISRSF